MQKITPNLWFDTNAEDAARYYTSIFPNSSIGVISRYNKEAAAVSNIPEGTALVVPFTIDGQGFLALNGGPIFKFNEAVSFVVDCKDQAEVDFYWSKLSSHPENEQCGWCKDQFGLSWQIVPARFRELMNDTDPAKVGRVMGAMMQMKKLDIAALEAAANG